MTVDELYDPENIIIICCPVKQYRKIIYNYLDKHNKQGYKKRSVCISRFPTTRHKKITFDCYECHNKTSSDMKYNYGFTDNNQDEYYTYECPICNYSYTYECNYDELMDGSHIDCFSEHNAIIIGTTIKAGKHKKDDPDDVSDALFYNILKSYRIYKIPNYKYRKHPKLLEYIEKNMYF